MALRDAAKLPQDKDCGAKAAQARRTIEGRVKLGFRAVATSEFPNCVGTHLECRKPAV